ncbi:MAG TPA: hypothetical protein VJ302_21045 [Blastocatellia bacterium]|nr:hypothetical protein [Blastocatellia bacterium]
MLSSPLLLIGDLSETVSNDPSDVVVIELLTPLSELPPLIIGKAAKHVEPGTLAACVFGRLAVVGYVDPIDSRQFRLRGEVFDYGEVDYFVEISI